MPELGYTLVILASGVLNGVIIPPAFTTVLNPAFEQFISSSQTFNTPSNASLFTGNFSGPFSIEISLSSPSGNLQMSSPNQPAFANLDWIGGNKFAIRVIPTDFSCLGEEEVALEGQQLEFMFSKRNTERNRHRERKATSFQDPGILYFFTRVHPGGHTN